MERKSFSQVDHEAKEKLPDANRFPDNKVTIKVNDNVGGIVNVTFKKYTDDRPYGWQCVETDYFKKK